MANFDSVIDGLDLAADIYDFHPEVAGAASAPGLGSPRHICSGTGLAPAFYPPLPEVGTAAGALAGSTVYSNILWDARPLCRLIRCNPSPQVWKSTAAVGWERMVLPGKVVPFA